jgi:lysophospholipid acyltransferase (LPLAT)-like uncharacterized protein
MATSTTTSNYTTNHSDRSNRSKSIWYNWFNHTSIKGQKKSVGLTQRVVGIFIATFLKALSRTYRVELIGFDTLPKSPLIFAIYHGDQLVLTPLRKQILQLNNRPLVVPSSQHKDGRLAAAVAEFLGLETVEGSTSRGAITAYRGLIKAINAEKNVVITVDGPRGPYGSVAPGILHLAAHSGYPIVPIGAAANRSLTFNSWDRMFLPLPFGRVRIIAGEPYKLPNRSISGRAKASKISIDVGSQTKKLAFSLTNVKNIASSPFNLINSSF